MNAATGLRVNASFGTARRNVQRHVIRATKPTTTRHTVMHRLCIAYLPCSSTSIYTDIPYSLPYQSIDRHVYVLYTHTQLSLAMAPILFLPTFTCTLNPSVE
jgi:hypothetical protein